MQVKEKSTLSVAANSSVKEFGANVVALLASVEQQVGSRLLRGVTIKFAASDGRNGHIEVVADVESP